MCVCVCVFIYIYFYVTFASSCPVRWGCRIHRLHLVSKTPNDYPGYAYLSTPPLG